MQRLTQFLRQEDGAITVDWVVLTALGAALMGAIMVQLQDGTTGLTDDTAAYMRSQKPTE